MILGRDLHTDLGMGILVFKIIIEGGDIPYKGYTEIMADLSNYYFRLLNLTNTVTPEESFMNFM